MRSRTASSKPRLSNVVRIDSISLSWFRGVAEQLMLETNGKSVVVYGPNGAGKSTFPDALEYVINNGKISHLSHEYSGSKLEYAVRNTHAPTDQPSVIEIQFDDGSKHRAEISAGGKCQTKASPKSVAGALSSVGLERLLLRQEEVSNFIHATKGQKYSVLLPLLGLEGLEWAATNFELLIKAVTKKTSLEQKRGRAELLEAELHETWPSLSAEEATRELEGLAKRYLDEIPSPNDLITKLGAVVEERAQTLEREQRRHNLLRRIADEGLDDALDKLFQAEKLFREKSDTLLSERIGVLEATVEYVNELDSSETDCPACGRPIEKEALSTHVHGILAGLGEARRARDAAHRERRSFGAKLACVQENLALEEVAEWARQKPERARSTDEIQGIDGKEIEEGPSLARLEKLREPLCALHSTLHDALQNPPPATAELLEHRRKVGVTARLIERSKLREEIDRIDELCKLLEACEKTVREETKTRTREVVESLTGDIQRLWEKLHPGEKVEDIHLHVPGDTDKAVDIALKFHGVKQPSPRLTLSEGHRNSLGLCIFFALALSGSSDTPVVLDDIVSSLDREHRGMLVKVFLQDFANRQVLLFTHDREWYSELRTRLPDNAWVFRKLKPWSDPIQGTQWLDVHGGFDDARRLLDVKPEAAGNEVRKVMDVELAKIAERLRVELPFQRGDRNDHRTGHEFLEKLISLGKTQFQRRNGKQYEPNSDPLKAWEECLSLLVSWANRASHGGSLTLVEAKELLTLSESVIASFRCSDCNDWVWAADQSSRERNQCSCGGLRWVYG